jgi:hypothetical protein
LIETRVSTVFLTIPENEKGPIGDQVVTIL